MSKIWDALREVERFKNKRIYEEGVQNHYELGTTAHGI